MAFVGRGFSRDIKSQKKMGFSPLRFRTRYAFGIYETTSVALY